MKSASAISKRDENIVREKQGRPYVVKGEQCLKWERGEEDDRNVTERKRRGERERRSATETERSRKEAANAHPSPYSLPPLTTPLHINPPLVRVESIARACA